MHTVYKITNEINNRIYVGVHKTDEVDDGYMGSGKAIRLAIKKYGRDNFTKEILVSFEDAEAAYLAESMVVDEAFVARKDTYNMKCGGIGGSVGFGEKHPMYGKQHSNESKKKMSDAKSGENHPFYGMSRSEETKAKLSAARSGEKHPNYGKHLSEETKAKLSAANMGENHPQFGIARSEETKAKLSAIKKEYWRKRREQQQ